MKPLLMRHVRAQNNSFKAWKNGDPYIHNPWHYHPEYEITYIHRGKGVLYVGDNILEYGHNEIILLGPNLPHEWRSEINNEPDLYSESVSAHFKYDFISESFYELPEMIRLNELLSKAKRGIRITDDFTKRYIKEKLLMLPETTGFKRIIKLMQILEKLSTFSSPTYLASNSFSQSIDTGQDQRINIVYEHVMNNFKDPISISDVASLVGMTNTSFCRFFKERTNKSFVNYLNEIRIGYACRLLLERNRSIAQIAYDSGFENISYFNRQFRNIKGNTPSGYLDVFYEDKRT